MPKKHWPSRRGYYDEELIRKKAEARERIKELLAEGTVEAEQEFVDLLKAVSPEMTPEELVQRVRLFRAAVSERGPSR